MPVKRGDVAAVLDHDGVAVAALDAAEDHLAVAGGPDRRSDRRRVIDALVGANRIEDRVLAVRIEVRADPSEVDGRADEGFAHAAAVRGVVVDVAGSVVVASRSVRRALVDEFRGDDVAVTQLHAVAPQLFVDHREFVAFANVLHEVDVPLEDARHCHDQLVRHAGVDARIE